MMGRGSDSSKEVNLAMDDPTTQATPEVRGPECPTCGDRFPSKETLQEHIEQEHKLTS